MKERRGKRNILRMQNSGSSGEPLMPTKTYIASLPFSHLWEAGTELCVNKLSEGLVCLFLH